MTNFVDYYIHVWVVMVYCGGSGLGGICRGIIELCDFSYIHARTKIVLASQSFA